MRKTKMVVSDGKAPLSGDEIQTGMAELPYMRAAMLRYYGVGFSIERMARAVPTAAQVSVRTAASGVNPLDVKIDAGTVSHAEHRCQPFAASTWPVQSKRSCPA